ncbi:FkbM family methyltransferase, partial [Stutzerimonas stutzeri]|uniref:FkbM family methyltransferase n=1 Tax=Stutzerimonas stutzeri TaxID=316 RepID=UPI001112ADB9
MSFVSYAQNFEDVMLWRALKHVENGFYIDIGAQHPVVDSVSLAFYEHGWRGVHVEPTLQYSSLLRAARPDESVFQLAIGNQSQQLTFFEFEDTGLSTADAEVARKHQERGFKCRETLVPILSLDALLQQVGARDIHWLKVDVEGLEKEVLESWQSSSNLPWVVVVESTRPLSQEKSHQEWEALLLVKGYSYVYFDGLNRFYVSPEHSELTEAFDAPPNVFDGFVLSGTASQPFYSLVSSRARQAEDRAKVAEDRAQQAEA